MKALKAAIRWLTREIQEDIFDDEHFKETQKSTLTEGYVDDVLTIRKALLKRFPSDRYHGEVK